MVKARALNKIGEIIISKNKYTIFTEDKGDNNSKGKLKGLSEKSIIYKIKMTIDALCKSFSYLQKRNLRTTRSSKRRKES